jgi:DNA polymerase III subunit beta
MAAKTRTQPETAGVMSTGGELRKAVNWVRPAALQGIRVSVSQGRLIVSAYNHETALIADLDQAVTGEPGAASVIVPGEALNGMIKALPTGRVPVEVLVHDGSKVDLTASPLTVKASRLTVVGYADTSAYPDLPLVPPLVGVVPADVFTRAAGLVLPAASADNVLPVLCGLNLTAGPDGLDLAATDRYRAVLHPVPWAGVPAAVCSVTVDARQVARFLKVCAGPVVVLYADPQAAGGPVVFTDGTWTLMHRRCAGEYPRVAAFVTRHATLPVTVTADAAALVPAVGAAAAVYVPPPAADNRMRDQLLLTAQPGGVTVTLLRDEKPVLTRDVPARLAGGGAFTARFNPVYLASMLGRPDGQVTLAFNPVPAGKDPGPVLVTRDTDPEYRGLVVGIRHNQAAAG